MSDLFHKDVPADYIKNVFAVMARADWHQFQILTKRSERLRELSPVLPWPVHIWQGVSVENEDYLDRVDDLRATGASVKFLSLEPLLGPLPKLKLRGIDWVIVGGESGPWCSPHAGRVGNRYSRSMHSPGCGLLFQAVGWSSKKQDGPKIRGADLG